VAQPFELVCRQLAGRLRHSSTDYQAIQTALMMEEPSRQEKAAIERLNGLWVRTGRSLQAEPQGLVRVAG
jgi:hypothetical protein